MEQQQDHFFGKSGFTPWMGICEDRNDPLKTGRARVRIFGWHTASKSLQPTEQLMWAHPMIPINSHDTEVKGPREGTMICGFFMDGEAGQHPVMLGIIPGVPDQTTEPTKGFSDPRDNTALQSAPRPPKSIQYMTDGTGAKITEQPNAHRYPSNLNEPTNSRISRHESIEKTIIQAKRDNTIQNVPVATGCIELPQVDLEAFIQLPSITIPPFAIGLNKHIGFEICGIGIGLDLSVGFLFQGITLGFPTILLDGTILIGGIAITAIIAGLIALGDAIALAIDLVGCILGGLRIGNNIMIDGGISIPLLPGNKFINPGSFGVRGTVSGGVRLGAMGGIPLSTTPTWNEPMTPYDAKYPYNHVRETESGHVFEVDDTPGAERIHTYHRSGTFDEIGPDGSRTNKVVKNDVHIVLADHNTLVQGNQHNTVNDQTNLVKGDRSKNVEGSETTIIKGDKTETVTGKEQVTNAKDKVNIAMQNRRVNVKQDDALIVEGNEHILILKDGSIVVKGDCKIAVGGKLTIGSKGDMALVTGGNFSLTVIGDTQLDLKGNYSAVVEKDYTTDIVGKFLTTTGKDFALEVGADYSNRIKGEELTTVGGNRTITVDGDSQQVDAGTFSVISSHTAIIPLPNF